MTNKPTFIALITLPQSSSTALSKRKPSPLKPHHARRPSPADDPQTYLLRIIYLASRVHRISWRSRSAGFILPMTKKPTFITLTTLPHSSSTALSKRKPSRLKPALRLRQIQGMIYLPMTLKLTFSASSTLPQESIAFLGEAVAQDSSCR